MLFHICLSCYLCIWHSIQILALLSTFNSWWSISKSQVFCTSRLFGVWVCEGASVFIIVNSYNRPNFVERWIQKVDYNIFSWWHDVWLVCCWLLDGVWHEFWKIVWMCYLCVSFQKYHQLTKWICFLISRKIKLSVNRRLSMLIP